MRDFMKVANSITRQAAPAGFFRGKSKLIYDYLYSRTRGAITPTRTVQVSWREIMHAAHIGSDKTLREHLAHLRTVGLINWENESGSRAGSMYTVYVPEELTTTPSTGGTGGNASQNQHPVRAVETTPGTGGVIAANNSRSVEPKTSFKTNTNDDEVFSKFNQILRDAHREVTGRNPTTSDVEKYADVARTLADELKMASVKTNITSPPAFLAEHLKRRLSKPDREGKVKPTVEAPALAPKLPQARLSPKEIVEQVAIIAELLQGGYSPEQAEAQFAASFNEDDWKAIKAAALIEREG